MPPRPGLVRAALVPNRRGAEDAVAAGIDEVTVTISASEAYNQRNVKMSTAASEAEIAAIVAVAGSADHERGIPVDAVISCAFGSPYEGEIAPADVAALAQRLLGAGVTSITLADTTGMATPRRIDDVLDASAAATGSSSHRSSACTSTTRGAPRWSTRTVRSSVASPGSTPRSAASGARPSPTALAATSPPRASWRCSTTSACAPGSRSTR
ncbi:MAG: hypothetical protein R2701_06025 [Acidimicrobiales bacterium]